MPHPYKIIPMHIKIKPLPNNNVAKLMTEIINEKQKDFFLPKISAIIPVGSSSSITVKA